MVMRGVETKVQKYGFFLTYRNFQSDSRKKRTRLFKTAFYLEINYPPQKGARRAPSSTPFWLRPFVVVELFVVGTCFEHKLRLTILSSNSLAYNGV